MEETLLTSIAKNVARHCSFSLEQIKDLFYIFKVYLKFFYFKIFSLITNVNSKSQKLVLLMEIITRLTLLKVNLLK
jgi:hypothetical protein